jgi:hypothetical protein
MFKKHILLFLSLGINYVVFSQSYNGLSFIENKGQWGDKFNFKAVVGDAVFFIEDQGYTVLKHDPVAFKQYAGPSHGHHREKDFDNTSKVFENLPDLNPTDQQSLPGKIRSHAYNVRFLGANNKVEYYSPYGAIEKANYFIGNDPKNWKQDVATYTSIVGKNLYDGVDVKYYSYGDKLKYDLLLKPGADPTKINLLYDGADNLFIKNRELHIVTSISTSRELTPIAYQLINNQKINVACDYVLSGRKVSFKLGRYDKNYPLVIDPASYVFTRFSGSKTANYGSTAAPGPDGSLYGGGIIFDAGFPSAIGSGYAGGQVDMGISRYDPNGKTIFNTYIGGSDIEYPHSIYVDGNGNAVILGRTNSNNFPLGYFHLSEIDTVNYLVQ